MAKDYGQVCPMARSLEFLGERWTLLIVRDLLRGPRSSGSQYSLAGVAPAVLSLRLKLLEERGVIQRRIYSDHPPRAEYSLTSAGMELRPVVGALIVWGSRHLDTPRQLAHKTCDHPIELAYYCAHCEQTLDSGDVTYRPRKVTRRTSRRRHSRVGGTL
jgi:DNA-binding HxlR family transcriptional regulator